MTNNTNNKSNAVMMIEAWEAAWGAYLESLRQMQATFERMHSGDLKDAGYNAQVAARKVAKARTTRALKAMRAADSEGGAFVDRMGWNAGADWDRIRAEVFAQTR